MFLLFSLALCKPVIVPQPLSLTFLSGIWTLVDGTAISYDKSVSGLKEVTQACADFLKAVTGYSITVTEASNVFGIALKASSTQFGDEEYQLISDANLVTIVASTYKGFFYGIQTLYQLLPPEVYANHTITGIKWEAPCVNIHDKPKYQWRGLMIDCSRHFFDVDILKRTMDQIAIHKLNVLHLHLTDDQGWRVEIKKYPLLTELGSVRDSSPKPWNRNQKDGIQYGPFYYTQDQLKELVRYAKTKCITIVPEIEMPGHSVGVLAGYPDFSCTGGSFKVHDMWGVQKDILCAGNPDVFPFLEDVLDEVMEIFDSPFIHTGGDEAPKDRWKKCEKCNKKMKDEGLKSYDELQAWFILHFAKYLESKGRNLIGWDEILEGGLPEGAAVMSWRGISGGQAAAAAGHNAVMCPTSHLYFDYAQHYKAEIYEYICCINTFSTVYAYNPLNKIPEEQQKYIIGTQECMWTEYVWGGEDDLQYKLFPRTCAFCEVAWSEPENKDWMRFIDGFTSVHKKRLDQLNIHCAPFTNSIATLESLNEKPEKRVWKLPNEISMPGTYYALFNVNTHCQINVKDVQLLVDGKLISQDNNEAIVKKHNNLIVKFDIKEPIPSTSTIEISSYVSSSDEYAHGEVYFYFADEQ